MSFPFCVRISPYFQFSHPVSNLIIFIKITKLTPCFSVIKGISSLIFNFVIFLHVRNFTLC